MKALQIITISALGFFFLFSCAQQKSLKNPIFNTTVFHGERGEKEVNAFNKNKAEREKLLAETIEKADAAKRKLEEQQSVLNSIDSTERIGSLDTQLQNLFKRTQAIIDELNKTSPYTSAGQEKTLKLATELNDLMHNYINPIEKLVEANKDVVRLGSDINFNTGSAVLTKEGKKKISQIVSSIVIEIEEWKGYLNHHNENIFSNTDYKTIIMVNGYADLQGSSDEKARQKNNLDLSEKRAKAVADELQLQLASLKEKYHLSFQIESKGRGEEIPGDRIQTSKKGESAARRISSISLVVGPKILLFNE
jgi:outer membrane protein OmpA-like peptidoglycan-associated protein